MPEKKRHSFSTYVESVGCLYDPNIQLSDIFQVFCDLYGETKLRKYFQRILNNAWQNEKSVNQSDATNLLSQYHERLKNLQKSSKKLSNKSVSPNNSDCDLSECPTRAKIDENKDDLFKYGHQVLSIKSILCMIFSFTDSKTFSHCCGVNRQWFHDSFDCHCCDTLNFDIFEKVNWQTIRKSLKRYRNCTKLLGYNTKSCKIWNEVCRKWNVLGPVDLIEFKMSSWCAASDDAEYQTMSRVLKRIASCCETLKTLKINLQDHQKENRLFHQMQEVVFDNLEHLEIVTCVPTLWCEVGMLQTLVLDIHKGQMMNLKTFLAGLEEDLIECEDVGNLQRFELTVRTRNVRGYGLGYSGTDVDDEDCEMNETEVSNLARLVCNVSVLKVHCPYLSIFNLLQEIATWASTCHEREESEPVDSTTLESEDSDGEDSTEESNSSTAETSIKLERLDARLEEIDNADGLDLNINIVHLLSNLKEVKLIIDDDFDGYESQNMTNICNLLSRVSCIRFGRDDWHGNPYRQDHNEKLIMKLVSTILSNINETFSNNCLKFVCFEGSHSLSDERKVTFDDILRFLNILREMCSKNTENSIFFKAKVRFGTELSFSQLVKSVPVFSETLGRVAEAAYLDLRIDWPYKTPPGVMDEYLDDLKTCLEKQKMTDICREFGEKCNALCEHCDDQTRLRNAVKI